MAKATLPLPRQTQHMDQTTATWLGRPGTSVSWRTTRTVGTRTISVNLQLWADGQGHTVSVLQGDGRRRDSIFLVDKTLVSGLEDPLVGALIDKYIPA